MKKNLYVLMLLSTMFMACTLITSTATPTPAVPGPEIVLTEVLQNFDGCRSVEDVHGVDGTYSFSCSHSADSIYTVLITTYDSAATAQAQFETDRGINAVSCFHGYDLYEIFPQSSNDQPSRISHQELHWQADRWVVSIYANYDYGFFHLKTIEFAEAVYTSSIEHDLIQTGECPNPGTASP